MRQNDGGNDAAAQLLIVDPPRYHAVDRRGDPSSDPQSGKGSFMDSIEKYLPHRPPFLFLDGVRIEGPAILASRLYREDEWFFKGHFPDYPVVPGVLLVEALAQAGGVGVKLQGIQPESMFVLAKIRSATFRRQVRPGDTLHIHVENLRSSSRLVHQKGTGTVEGEIAVEAEWIAMASGVPE
jgi:3-hydroxyacyl-[acyl-carrier-protein] dehydratase